MARRRKVALSPEETAPRTDSPLRIIGGTLRGRKLLYAGDERTRPMKNRVREAVFNLLGTDVVGKHAIDLFAGTGALGLEAISRGAVTATLIERHFPTADIIRQNAEQLGLSDVTQIESADTFIWARRTPQPGAIPWLVFCSPPYALFTERLSEMLKLIGGLVDRAPRESVIVVETDLNFDFALVPLAGQWFIRAYPPAVIGIYRKQA